MKHARNIYIDDMVWAFAENQAEKGNVSAYIQALINQHAKMLKERELNKVFQEVEDDEEIKAKIPAYRALSFEQKGYVCDKIAKDAQITGEDVSRLRYLSGFKPYIRAAEALGYL